MREHEVIRLFAHDAGFQQFIDTGGHYSSAAFADPSETGRGRACGTGAHVGTFNAAHLDAHRETLAVSIP